MVILDISAETIQADFKSYQEALAVLEHQERAEKAAYNTTKKEIDELLPRMGWREKYLSGFLGGDRSVVLKLNSAKARLAKKRSNLIAIDKKLKVENGNLAKNIKSYLTKNSPAFKKLGDDVNRHIEMYNATAEFYNFLVQAKKAVTDALLLTSWENLLDHPNARSGLTQFHTHTAAYQREVKTYDSEFNVSLLNGVHLEDYIQFSSERVAMESFDRIFALVTHASDYCEKKLEENKLERNVLIDQLKKAITL